MRRYAVGLCFLISISFGTGDLAEAQQLQSGNEKLRIEVNPDDAVTLYAEPGFRGRSESFRYQDRRLGDNRIGNDGAASVRVPRGCRVTLFEHYDFKGRSIELDRDVQDLARTRMGRREVSSLKVSCKPNETLPDTDTDPERGLRGRRGALVFSESGFRGRYNFFDQNAGDLSRHEIGNDAISSVRVAAGCRLTLFTDRGFSGEAVVIRNDLPNLRRTRSGADTASSLMVNCEKHGGGAILYSDSHFRGRRQILDRDAARLSETQIGDDRVGSVRVAPGCRVTLFDQPGFRGASLVIEDDLHNLSGTSVGPDAASSVKVACKRGPATSGDLPHGSGVWLFERSYFVGKGVHIRGDVANLADTDIGNDRAVSIRVAPGCEAVLHRDPNFRRRGVRVTSDVADLGRLSGVGQKTLSSIRVRCDRSR